MDETQKLSNLFHGLTILQHCGSGTFGDVYYCHDASHVNMVVKKIPKKRLGGAWRRELKGLRNYQKVAKKHSSLLQIYHAADDDDEFLYYTMEAADNTGKTGQRYVPDLLGERLKAGGLDYEDVLNVADDLIHGLKIMHDAEVFHRDVKPMNVVFIDGTAKLGDIGLVTSEKSMMTSLVGTLEFIPPEILTGSKPASSVNCESDVYALGKVIYCSFTGNDPDEFPSLPADLPIQENWVKQLTHLVMKLCDKNPNTRISNINEAARLVAETRSRISSGKSYQQNGLKHAFYHLLRFGRENRKILAGVFAGIFILICFLLIINNMKFSQPVLPGLVEPNSPIPILHYKFDDNTVNSGSLGEHYDGVSHGDASYSTDAAKGRYSADMGTKGYVWVPAFAFGSRATVATWLKGNFTGPVKVIPRDCMNTVFSTRDKTNSPSGALLCVNQWKVQNCAVVLETGIPSVLQKAVTSPGVLQSNAWHHLALVVDRPGGFIKIYVDGVLKHTGTCNNFLGTFTDNQPMYIGVPGRGGWWHFRGRIDDFRVYDKTLSEEEIKLLAVP
jgi:serine/threonine protein kinase